MNELPRTRYYYERLPPYTNVELTYPVIDNNQCPSCTPCQGGNCDYTAAKCYQHQGKGCCNRK